MNNTTPPPFCPKPKAKRGSLTITKRILVAIFAIIAYSIAVYFGGKTLYNLWIPWTIAIVIASGCVALLRKYLKTDTSTIKSILNFIIHTVCVTGLVAGLIFSLNYAYSDNSAESTVSAKVINKYSQTRYHTKRVGRRYTGQGRPYKVYYIVAELPDGRTKEFSQTLSQYNQTDLNSKIQLSIEPGLLSMPVIKESRIITQKKHRKSNHRVPFSQRQTK